MANIDGYKKILKQLAAKGSGEFINNSSPDHAAAMIEVLFEHANEKVYIVTDHLNPDIYGREEVMRAVIDFIQKDGSELGVIMQFNEMNQGKDKLKLNSFLSSLKSYHDKISLYEAVDQLKTFKYHFLVTKTEHNQYAMRYELDTKNHIATGTFNAREIGQELFAFFEKAKNVMPKIEDQFWVGSTCAN